MASSDRGARWDFLPAIVPHRVSMSNSIKRDGSLWALVCAAYGIGESVSHDRGKTWGRQAGGRRFRT